MKHAHTETQNVLNRLSRIIGHLEGIKRMVAEERSCSEVLIQLSAVKSAVNNTQKLVLKDHISHCLVDAIQHGNETELAELSKAIDQFL